MRRRAAPERRPDRDLARSAAAADDEQVGNVDAGDEEEEPRGRGEGEHRGPDVADDVLRQRTRDAAQPPPAARGLRPLEEARQLGARVAKRRARSQPADHMQLGVDRLIAERTRARNDGGPEVDATRVVQA